MNGWRVRLFSRAWQQLQTRIACCAVTCNAFRLLCREYRIPIKAALNGTAGAHTLKVVISPAATIANQKAADYKYNVPGLTQPGGLPSHHTSVHDHPAMLSAADNKLSVLCLVETRPKGFKQRWT